MTPLQWMSGCRALQSPLEGQRGNLLFTTPHQLPDLTFPSSSGWCHSPQHPSAFPGHRWDPCQCRQVPTGSAPVPGGLGGVCSRGELLSPDSWHPGPQHRLKFPSPPSEPARNSPSGLSFWSASSCGTATPTPAPPLQCSTSPVY